MLAAEYNELSQKTGFNLYQKNLGDFSVVDFSWRGTDEQVWWDCAYITWSIKGLSALLIKDPLFWTFACIININVTYCNISQEYRVGI